QAEDGIRDFHVTGVQTCALPIFDPLPVQSENAPAQSADVSAEPTADPSRQTAEPRCTKRDYEALVKVATENGWTEADVKAYLKRSEERRVGKECRCRWGPGREKE